MELSEYDGELVDPSDYVWELVEACVLVYILAYASVAALFKLRMAFVAALAFLYTCTASPKTWRRMRPDPQWPPALDPLPPARRRGKTSCERTAPQ